MDALRAGDPRQVGVYRLVSRLGDGGMGQVFLGVSPGGRPVAVKVIRPELAADPEFLRRFAHEVEAARRVGGFHTAPVVDSDPYADRPWMVTAYIAGPSLRAVVTDGGPLSPVAVATLGAGLTEGLAAIHRTGLVHRDLKPANIIMADDGRGMESADPAGGLHLAGETAQELRVGGELGPYHLHRDRATAGRDPEEYLSHPAVADAAHQPVDADLARVPGTQRIHRSPAPITSRRPTAPE
jgi:serine/threonine protein kinase